MKTPNLIYFPPDKICQIGINPAELITGFNTFSDLLKTLKKVEFFQHENELKIVNQSNSIFINSDLDLPSCLNKCTNQVELNTPLIPELYATIQNYFSENPDSKIGVKIQEQNNLPVASDGSRIYARGTFDSNNPFLIYSKNSATFAKESEIIKDCLCLNPPIPLLPPLQHTKDTLKTHIAKLETETLDLKTGIFTITERFTNHTLYLDNEYLKIHENTNTLQTTDCFPLTLSTHTRLETHTIPARITPNNLNTSQHELNKCLNQMNTYVLSSRKAEHLIEPSTRTHPTLRAHTPYNDIALVLGNLNTNTLEHKIIITLISTQVISIVIFVITLSMSIGCTRRGLLYIHRSLTLKNSEPTEVSFSVRNNRAQFGNSTQSESLMLRN